MLVAATPFWLADNLLLIGIITIVLACGAVLWFVHTLVLKLLLLLLLALSGIVVYVNRDEVQTCGHTCKCRIVRIDINVPRCKPDPDF